MSAPGEPPDVDCAGNAAAGHNAWERGLEWWQALSVLIMAGVLVALWSATDVSLAAKLAATALNVALVVAYAGLGIRRLNRSSTPRMLLYFGGMLVLFAAAVVIFRPTAFFLAVLCPRFFMMLEIRWAILPVVAFNGVPTGYSIGAGGWSPRATLTALIWGTLIVGCSMVLALWIRGIIRQSAERAELIEELEVTRRELADANHEAGVLAERERLASEIHDTLAQGFTSILMLLQAVESEIDRDPGQSRHHLNLAQRTARENLTEARTLVTTLAPARLEDTSLVDALRRLVDDVGAALGAKVDFQAIGEPRPLPAGIEVVLLRATQEALANVRKHAGAAHLSVQLSYEQGTQLEITDDGRGFDPAEANGFGLRGMRSRVEQVGGSLDVVSSPEAGTTTRVRLP